MNDPYIQDYDAVQTEILAKCGPEPEDDDEDAFETWCVKVAEINSISVRIARGARRYRKELAATSVQPPPTNVHGDKT